MGCISYAGSAYFDFVEFTSFTLQKWFKIAVKSKFGQ